MMYEASVDFPLQERIYKEPSLAIDPLTPFKPGVTLYAAESFFLALPQEEGRSMLYNMADAVAYLAPEVCFTLVFLLCIILLINWSPKERRFKSRLSVASLAAMVSLRASWSFVKAHRRVAVLSALVLVFMFNQMFGASLHSNLVLTLPPRYLESLAEVATAADRPPLIPGGLNIETQFRYSPDPIKRQIEERARKGGTIIDNRRGNSITTVAELIVSQRGVAFLSAAIIRHIVSAIVCLQTDYSNDQQMRYSDPFDEVLTCSVYRRGIEPEIEMRLRSVFQRYMEAGIYDKSNSDPISRLKSILNVEKAVLCLQQIVSIHHSDPTDGQEVDKVCLSSYGHLLPILAGILAFALASLSLEACCPPRRQGRRDKRRL